MTREYQKGYEQGYKDAKGESTKLIEADKSAYSQGYADGMKAQEPRWISVEEKLPEIHNYTEKYLVTLERGWVRTAMCTQCDGKHWWTYDDVVAWMPLPKPYNAESEE